MTKLIKIKDESAKWGSLKIKAMDSALERMAKDIKQVAWITIPFLTGALQQATESDKKGLLDHRVIANKEYASYQERGVRKDGTHKVRRYSTPGTGSNYLKKAGNKIVKDAINYLRQANNLYRL